MNLAAEAFRRQEAGDWAGAEALYRQLLDAEPDNPDHFYNFGIVCKNTGRFGDAVACQRRALELRPDFPEAANNVGTALLGLGQIDAAVAAFRQAVGLRPAFPEAWNNLGSALKFLGRVEEAIPCLETAVRLQPDRPAFLSNLIYALHYCPGQPPAALLAAARRWQRAFGGPVPLPPMPADRSIERRVKVGYVSATFHDHCQSFFTIPLFAHHDHRQFEIFAYADGRVADSVTARIRGSVDQWRAIAGRTDPEVAELIRADGIDVLVDLNVHSAPPRLGVFALRPAPVQVSWLGYPGTTGLDAIDYRLTDRFLDPPGASDGAYAEESYRLPDSFWCYDPLTAGPAVNPLPALSRGRIAFGCLNNFCKVNEPVLRLWGQVLRAVPDSTLRVMAPAGSARTGLAGRLGVAEDRVEFCEFAPRPEYLERYHHIDLGLDTFPYNGHTTNFDALWMGVPVVSLCGETAVSRAGLSLLAHLGLRELVATEPAEFVRIAVELAGNRPRLADLRATLRDRLVGSPLMDARAFARGVEAAYLQFWRRAGRSPTAPVSRR